MAVAIPGLYAGTAFATMDGKGRVSVPMALRSTIPVGDDGARTLWVSNHEKLPCLVGFGQDYMAKIPEEIDRDEDRAVARNVEFDRDAAFKDRFGFAESYTLDGSGRFVMTATHKMLAAGGKHYAFVGAGRRFEIWALEELVECEAANPRLRAMAAAMLKAEGEA